MSLTKFSTAAFLVVLPLFGQAKTVPLRDTAATSQSQVILLAVDGLSHNAFLTAQKMGLLKDFKVGAHVAPFPSMSDVSWNSIMRTTDVFGEQGRLKSAEAVYFDESTQSLEGDPRDYYRRQAHSKYYMGAFEHFMNPYVESLMYLPTDEIPKMEVKTVIDELLAAAPKPVLTGFIAATDSMAHTQHMKLFPIVKTIDAEIKRLVEGFRARGIEPKIILVSDHGNVGRFAEGGQEIELEKIELKQEVEALGYKFAQTLETSLDVAVPLLALGSWAPVYVKDRRELPKIAHGLANKPWFDLAVMVKSSSAEMLVMTIFGKSGDAEVSYEKQAKTYSYRAISGNPLNIADVNGLDASAVGKLTVETQYPDSLFRLVEAGLHHEFDFPDMILTSKDGTCFNNSLSSLTKMYRTHGALNRSASLGIVASNFSEVPAYIRSKNILPNFGIDAASLYGRTYELFKLKPDAAFGIAAEGLSSGKGIPTDARDFSTPRVFRYLTRFVSDTRPFFVINELTSLFKTFSTNPLAPGATPGATSFDVSKLDYKGLVTPDDLGKLTDELIRNPNPETAANGPVLKGLMSRIKAQANLPDLPVNSSQGAAGLSEIFPQSGGYGVAAKRSAMKLYQVPALLERALTLPERQTLKETRDLQFARYWSKNRESFATLKTDVRAASPGGSPAARLFSEAHKESQIAEKIFPAQLTRLYNHQLSGVTIVYVPGIYNSIFDKEIFSLGLLKLEEDLGLRVLRAPVESTCSTRYNGKLLMDFLKKDSADRVARGHDAPKYMILAYSKGGPDSLAGFIQDPAWVSKNVSGLMSIASPLHGSSILDKADLPFQMVDALSANGGPQACKGEEAAGKSVTPSAMGSFWRKNGRALVGLTRYYSIAFQSEIENSHLFMKATKLIGQFDEDNDGVVTVSSARFPENLGAVDFGVVEADHLSGVLSSRFDQKAFMNAIATSLAEIGADDEVTGLKFNLARMVDVANRNAKESKLSFSTSGKLARIFKGRFFNMTTTEVAAGAKMTIDWNQMLLPKINDPADSYEPKLKLPESNLKYDPYALIDLRKLMSTDIATAKVKPMLPAQMPQGIDMTFNHKNMVHFRMDHQFNFESTVQHNADDNATDGFLMVDRGQSGTWAQMKSHGTSIRLTTMAYRFKPVDYPKTAIQMVAVKPVTGADVIKGGSGKDDSAFQVWLTIRVGNATNDRATLDPKKDRLVLFGYYWGTKDSTKETTAGQLFENYYSNKNFVVATLPEAKEVLLENPMVLNKELNLERNLAEDLKRAFPNDKVEDLEVIAITLQHDSNDTKSESEVLLKSLKFGR